MNMTDAQLAVFYRNHLERMILPFWTDRAPDREQGGVFTCWSNDGSELLSHDKYIWTQGRYLWLLARSVQMVRAGRLSADEALLLELAAETREFLRYARLEGGNYAFLLSGDGQLKEAFPGQGHDISFYVDCFVALGLGEYARLLGDTALFAETLELYDGISRRLEAGSVRSEPYPVPAGCRAHAYSMIMLNVAQELEETAAQLGDAGEARLAADARRYVTSIMADFVQPDGTLREILGSCGQPVLEQHLNPGHAIESMWFVLQEAQKHGWSDIIERAAQTVRVMFELGWDEQHGGLLRFVFPAGPTPEGEPAGAFERMIMETRDTKIWWPHSESLYATLLAGKLTGDDTFRALHDRVHDYTFRTFPNPDAAVGEWIQIRDRAGEPLEKVVALPVKDPYHVWRNLLLLVELLPAGQTISPKPSA
jgi:N-acylglucosamine 2-epimerase